MWKILSEIDSNDHDENTSQSDFLDDTTVKVHNMYSIHGPGMIKELQHCSQGTTVDIGDGCKEGFAVVKTKKAKRQTVDAQLEQTKSKSKLYIFSDASNWIDFRYQATVSTVREALRLIRRHSWRWAHIFDVENKKVYDVLRGTLVKNEITEANDEYLKKVEVATKLK